MLNTPEILTQNRDQPTLVEISQHLMCSLLVHIQHMQHSNKLFRREHETDQWSWMHILHYDT